MTWLLWRQHRNQTLLAALALSTFVIVAAVTGVHMAATYHGALRTCAATRSCDSVGDGLFDGDGAIIDLVNLTVVVPVLIGLFWGAPLLAREIEDGTHRFVWTQSVTRRHWLVAKTIALLSAATLVGAGLAVSVTWWSRTLDLTQHNRFARFDIQGIVPVGYALFGAALGLAAGMVVRRVLPALAATLAVLVAVRFVVANFVRPHFQAPVTRLVSLTAAKTGIAGSSWTLHSHLVTPGGKSASNGNLLSVIPDACRPLLGTSRAQIFSCLDAQGFREKVVYQPANRFWTFQFIEAGLFVVLAAALVALTFALLHRDA
jgi:ABC-2 family transporter protein